MKKTFILIMTILIISTLFVGCATLTYPQGVFVMDNFEGSKVGQATGMQILYIFGNVDISIQTAARNGGITRISSVEVIERNTIFYKVWTVIVRGD